MTPLRLCGATAATAFRVCISFGARRRPIAMRDSFPLSVWRVTWNFAQKTFKVVTKTMPNKLIGHHGTSRERAETILAEGFTASQNSYDWLGDGVYFWQDAPLQAMEWASKNFGTDACVVESTIEIRDFINLLDVEWMSWLTDVHDEFLKELRRAGRSPPNQSEMAHRLDRAVINFGVKILEDAGLLARGVIGAFREGRPVLHKLGAIQP